MGRKTRLLNFWLRRRSHLPVIIIGTLVVLMLYLNDETSVSLNMEYDRQIEDLRRQIAEENDSMLHYRRRREAVEAGKADLEHLARENYHMQRPTEDVFILREP